MSAELQATTAAAGIAIEVTKELLELMGRTVLVAGKGLAGATSALKRAGENKSGQKRLFKNIILKDKGAVVYAIEPGLDIKKLNEACKTLRIQYVAVSGAEKEPVRIVLNERDIAKFESILQHEKWRGFREATVEDVTEKEQAKKAENKQQDDFFNREKGQEKEAESSNPTRGDEQQAHSSPEEKDTKVVEPEFDQCDTSDAFAQAPSFRREDESLVQKGKQLATARGDDWQKAAKAKEALFMEIEK